MDSRIILRFFKALMGVLLLLTGLLILNGHEFLHGNITPVNVMLAILFIIASIACFSASLTDRKRLYDFSFVIANFSLTCWVFTLAAYALFGLSPWGRVVVFAYVLIQNNVILPYLLTMRLAEDAISHSNEIIEKVQQRREERERKDEDKDGEDT